MNFVVFIIFSVYLTYVPTKIRWENTHSEQKNFRKNLDVAFLRFWQDSYPIKIIPENTHNNKLCLVQYLLDSNDLMLE